MGCSSSPWAQPGGEDYAQLGNVVRVDIDMVETIAEVSLIEIDVSKLGICQKDFTEDSIKSLPELHGLLGRDIQGLRIN